MVRSYLWGIDIRVNLDVTQDGRTFVLGATYPFGQKYTIVLKEKFYNWSSNNYTLDYPIEESYYENLADPNRYPMSFGLAYFAADDFGRPVIVFFPFNLPFVDSHYREFPPAPSDYWLQGMPT
jgi:hypothetical protein